MSDHIGDGGEQGGTIAQELMEAGAGRSGLDRRRLLGGVVAGAAGLLLPRLGATAQVDSHPNDNVQYVKLIRYEIYNRAWGNDVTLEAYWPDWFLTSEMHWDNTWVKQEVVTPLKEGSRPQYFESFSYVGGKKSYFGYESLFRVDINGYWVLAANPGVGLPQVGFNFGPFEKLRELKPNEGVARQVPGSNRQIRVTRKDDTTEFKVFAVELEKASEQGPIGGKQDKKDKKDKKDDNKRRRKRGGGGGLSDVDRRERPADRLLD